jgi:hypothetical protein
MSADLQYLLGVGVVIFLGFAGMGLLVYLENKHKRPYNDDKDENK